MADQRRAGIITLKTSGEIQDCGGEFTYNLGRPKRDTLVGPDAVHGYTEKPQVAFIEGEIVDRGTLDVTGLVTGKDLTITLELANGKTIVLRDAWYAHEGTASTDNAKIPVRWEGTNAEEVP